MKKTKLKSPKEWATDSGLEFLLNFNKTAPIKYKNIWLPKGVLKKLLDSWEGNNHHG